MEQAQRRGYAYGIGAHLGWGLFPLYWKLLGASDAVEILAHRVLWSMLTLVGLVAALRRLPQLRALARTGPARNRLALAGALITCNWGIYIWAVTAGHVVETALGYFINPLITVMLGVLVLAERLRRVQWVALGIAAVAVFGLGIEYGRLPWIALALAFSFGGYGLVKKQAGAPAVEGMALETAVIVLPAVGFLGWIGITGQATATDHGGWYLLLIAACGPVSALPLMLFGAAATRVPMSRLGMIQYLTPCMQFALGVLVFDEPMPAPRLAGFALVWLALLILSVDGLRHRRRTISGAAIASAA